MSKTLVIGSSGHVGGALLTALRSNGEAVRAARRTPNGAGAGVETVRFDYGAPETYTAALDGVDGVFAMSPGAPEGQTLETFMTPFLRTAAAAGKKIVLMSTLSCVFDETEPMLAVERNLRESGSRFVILRPNWFMDNFHTYWVQPIREGGVLPLPAGDSRTAFIDSRDIAAAAAGALRTDRFDGQTVALNGPAALNHTEVAEALSQAAGRTITYVPVDDEAFIRSLLEAGLPSDYAQYLDWLYQGTRRGLAEELSSGVADLTGAAPRPFAQYAADHAESWRKG